MTIFRDDSPFKLERASPPPSSDLSHPLSGSHPLLSNPTSSSSHSAYNPIWSPASISPSANDLMSGPGSGEKNLSLKWEEEDVGFDWKKNITQFQIEQGTFPARNQEVTQGRGYTGQTTGDNILITASASSFQSIIITINIITVIKIIMIMKITRCYYTNMDYLTPPGMHSGLNVPVRKPF